MLVLSAKTVVEKLQNVYIVEIPKIRKWKWKIGPKMRRRIDCGESEYDRSWARRYSQWWSHFSHTQAVTCGPTGWCIVIYTYKTCLCTHKSVSLFAHPIWVFRFVFYHFLGKVNAKANPKMWAQMLELTKIVRVHLYYALYLCLYEKMNTNESTNERTSKQTNETKRTETDNVEIFETKSIEHRESISIYDKIQLT